MINRGLSPTKRKNIIKSKAEDESKSPYVMRLISVVFFLLSVIFIRSSYIDFKANKKFINEAEKAQGVVIEMMYAGQRAGKPVTNSRCPVVEYVNSAREKRRFTGFCAYPYEYKVGQLVEVIYTRNPIDYSSTEMDHERLLDQANHLYGYDSFVFPLAFFLGGGFWWLAGSSKFNRTST